MASTQTAEKPEIALKRLVQKEYQKLFKDPNVKMVLEKLAMKHNIPVEDALKTLLSEMESEASELQKKNFVVEFWREKDT